jgi:hypothetical protein
LFSTQEVKIEAKNYLFCKALRQQVKGKNIVSLFFYTKDHRFCLLLRVATIKKAQSKKPKAGEPHFQLSTLHFQL